MNIDELKIFVTVAQTLNFTKAAERLHFSQPTLSRHISILEQELQHPLLIRTTRTVKLTEFGQYFLVEAQRLLKSYNQLMEQMSNLGEQKFGNITIGTPDLMTRALLPSVIRSFHAKYPGVIIDVHMIEPGACISLLKNKVIDVGFFASTDTDVIYNNMVVQPLSSGKLVFVCSQDHRLSRFSRATPLDLRGERIYIPNRSNTPYLWNTVSKFLDASHLSPGSLEEMDSPHSMMMMVEAGLGVTVLASNLISELGNVSGLHMIKMAGLEAKSQLYFAYSKENDNLCVESFIAELKRNKPAEPDDDIDNTPQKAKEQSTIL